MRFAIEPSDKVVEHKWPVGKWQRAGIAVGPNPFGPRGGRCGNILDGYFVRIGWARTKRLEKALAACIRAADEATRTGRTVIVEI